MLIGKSAFSDVTIAEETDPILTILSLQGRVRGLSRSHEPGHSPGTAVEALYSCLLLMILAYATHLPSGSLASSNTPATLMMNAIYSYRAYAKHKASLLMTCTSAENSWQSVPADL